MAQRWADFPTADRAGWTAMIDLGDVDGDEVVVSAYAFLEPRRHPAEGEPPRLGPVRHIGTARCQVRGDRVRAASRRATSTRATFVTAGYVHVTVTIQSIEDVATVELLLDGARRDSPGPRRARSCDANSGLDRHHTRFDGVVVVSPTSPRCRVTAVVTLVTGQSFELRPWHVDVSRPEVAGPTRRGPAGARPGAHQRPLEALARGTAAQAAAGAGRHADLGLGGGQLYLHELMLRLARRVCASR